MRKQNDQKKEHHSLPYLGLPRLWPYIRQYRGRIIAMVLMGMFCSIIDAVFPLFNRYALNHFVGEKTLDTLVTFIVLYIAVLLVQIFQTIGMLIARRLDRRRTGTGAAE